MFTGTVLLVQFATLMLAVGVIPFLPESGPLSGAGVLPLLGLLVGVALLAAFAPQVLRRILSSARMPVASSRGPLRREQQTGNFSLPTDPGVSGSPRPRAPSVFLGVHA